MVQGIQQGQRGICWVAISQPSALPVGHYTHYTMKLLFTLALAQLVASAAGQVRDSAPPRIRAAAC